MTEGRMYRLRTLVRQIYGGRALRPGDELPNPVPERVALALIRMQFVEEIPEDAPAAPAVAEESVTQPVVRKRRYRRRDMKAEGA